MKNLSNSAKAARALLLCSLTLAGAAYAANTNTAAAPAAAATPAAPTAKQLAALCDTCAIVTATRSEKRKGKPTALGTAGGAVAGGVVGNKVGDGGVLATGAGAVAGAVVGRELEKQLKKHTVWVTTVTTKDGKSQTLEALADPQLKAGDAVRIENGALVKLNTALK